MRRHALSLCVVVLTAVIILPATADTPSRRPQLVRLSERGPGFMAYDGTPDLRASGRDWPVSLIFAGNASVTRVKAALASLGFNRRGETRYLAYREPSGSLRVDGDRGLKTGCDRNGTDLHLRLYAPTAADRFAPGIRQHGRRHGAPRPRRRLFDAADRVWVLRARRTPDRAARVTATALARRAGPAGTRERRALPPRRGRQQARLVEQRACHGGLGSGSRLNRCGLTCCFSAVARPARR